MWPNPQFPVDLVTFTKGIIMEVTFVQCIFVAFPIFLCIFCAVFIFLKKKSNQANFQVSDSKLV